MKKIIILMALFSVLLPLKAGIAVGDTLIDGVYYEIVYDRATGERTAELARGDNKNIEEIVIPSFIVYAGNTYEVNRIGNQAFYKFSGLTSVVIPNSVKSIGQSAFYGCTSLESITIPESVTTIEDIAFYGCTSLKSVVIPESVKEWGYNVFGVCKNLESVNIPNDVVASASQTFDYCTGLKHVTFSDKVTMIGKELFRGCTGLETIDIPSNIKTVGNGAFVDCTNLASVTFHEGLETIEDAAFNNCDALTSISFPNSVISIGSKVLSSNASGTFAGCDNLKSITWGNGITLIPSYGFYGCTSLESIDIPNNLKEIGDMAFRACGNLKGDIVLPYGTTYIGKGAFAGTNITSIKIPSTVTEFAANALHDNFSVKKVIVPSLKQWCEQIDFNSGSVGAEWHTIGLLHYADLYIEGHEDTPIRDVVIPEGVKRVNQQAFYDASITSVDIPSSVDSIYTRAFQYCEKLKTIKFHEGLKYIGAEAFEYCDNISSINLPEGLQTIQAQAFAFGKKLPSVNIPNSVTISNANVFRGCESLESVKIGNGLTSIPRGMFSECTNLQFIEIPNNVTAIGSSAFGGCKRLKKIIFPNSITNVAISSWGTGAFDGCDSLTQVIVPDFNIADWCWKYLPGGPLCYTHHIYDYEGNDLIVDAIIPEGVTQVIGYAFQGCESMISLTFPSTLTTINRVAFQNCCNLKSVTCKMQEPDANINAFQYFAGISPECVLHVPLGTKENYIAKGWTEDIFKGGIVEVDFDEEQGEDPVYEDVTDYIVNAGFDEDLTWQADGSTKEIVNSEKELSSRSLGYLAADNSIYAFGRGTRPDGYAPAWNGFFGQIAGWTKGDQSYTGKEYYPYGNDSPEWVYFGSMPYSLGETSIAKSDDGTEFFTVPEKPTAVSGEDNIGFLYLSAGWGGAATYKQVVKLPCAKYRLEYWAINLNPSATNGINLSRVVCRNDEFRDEAGFNDTEWTLHTIEFTPTAEFTIEFGFRAEGGSRSNPFLCIDGIKLYKIGEAEESAEELLRSDIAVVVDELSALGELYSEYNGIVNEINAVVGETTKALETATSEEELFAIYQNINTYKTNIMSLSSVLQEIEYMVSNAAVMMQSENPYPGIDTFIADMDAISKQLQTATSDQMTNLRLELSDVIQAYLDSFDSRLDGIYYQFNNDNLTAIVISGEKKYEGDVVIPESVEHDGVIYTVIGIGDEAFQDCDGLTSVSIPESVTCIGYAAFLYSGLNSIIIPNSVTSIKGFAFAYCSKLTSVAIPNSVTTIGERAFSQCWNLTTLTIPNNVNLIGEGFSEGCYNLSSIIVDTENEYYDSRDGCNAIIETSSNKLIVGCKNTIIPNSVTCIGVGAFFACDLTSLIIPNSVTNIEKNAFYGYRGTTVTIPESVVNIGEGAFGYSTNLTSIIVEKDNTVYDSRNNCNAIIETSSNTLIVGCNNSIIPDGITAIGKSAFHECYGLTSVTIPSSVTNIGKGAFEWCSHLTTLTIPRNVRIIGEEAFLGCSGLTDMFCYAKAIPETGDELFHLVKLDNVTLHVPASSLKAYSTTEPWSNFGNIVALDEEPIIASDLYYEYDDENLTATVISGEKKYEGDVVIPESVEHDGATYVITKIGQDAFSCCENLTSVIVPKSVTSIGSWAFYQCNNLTALTIPNSVIHIGIQAFSGCNSLEAVTIPSSVTKIEQLAFQCCGALTSMKVEDGNPVYDSRDNCNAIIETASNTLIAGCERSIIPNTVSSIKEGAFYGSSGLTSVTIPNSVTSIEKEVFSFCSSLTSIKVEGGNPVYDSRDNCNAIIETVSNTLIAGCQNTTIPTTVTSIGSEAFHDCRSLTTLAIPNSVISIGDDAFWQCINLTTITIPNSVTSIGNYAFYSCFKLNDVYCYTETVPVIDSEVFLNVNLSTSTLHVPSSSLKAYSATEPWSNFGNIVALGEEPIIASDLYYEYDDKNLTATVISGEKKYEGDIVIPESVEKDGIIYTVTEIGERAFYYCSDLTSVTIPTTVLSIGEQAFQGCSGLTSLWVESGNPVYDSRDNCNAVIETASNTLIAGGSNSFIPNGITSIGGGAFSYRRGLTSITIPESVTSIGWTAFESTDLTSVTFPKSVTSIGAYAFCSTQIVSLTIPKNVTSIGSGAFSNCYYLKSVQVENGNPVYDSRDNCNAIIETASNTLIEGWEFSSIPNSITAIGEGAFVYCGRLTSIDIPSSVTSIGSEAFWGCGLTSVTIPKSVKFIGGYAFYCPSLTDMYCYAKKVPETNWEIFMDVDMENATLHVPAASLKAYSNTEPWRNFGNIVALDDEPITLGDANSDGEVDVTDVVSIVNYILGKPSASFNADAADVNCDGEVDITDVVAVVNIILGKRPNEAKEREAAVAGTLTAVNENGNTNLLVDDAKNFVAMQLDVVMPEGHSLMDAQLNSTSNHAMVFNRTGENRYTVLAYSVSNEAFEPSNAALVTLLSDGAEVAIEHAVFITTDGRRISMDVSDLATDIATIQSNTGVDAIYNLSGQRVATDMKMLPKGVHIIHTSEGKVKKVFVK